MKFSIEKRNLQTMLDLQHDKEFHERAVNRINIDWDVILIVERQRVGMLKNKVEKVDLIKGEIEYGNIMVTDKLPDKGNSKIS